MSEAKGHHPEQERELFLVSKSKPAEKPQMLTNFVTGPAWLFTCYVDIYKYR
jgi:hypothetical protein